MDEPIDFTARKAAQQQQGQKPARLPKRGVRRRLERIAAYAGVDPEALAKLLNATEQDR